MFVLIVTHSRDPLDRVFAGLRARGVEPVRLDTDLVGTTVMWTFHDAGHHAGRPDDDTAPLLQVREASGREVTLTRQTLRAVWYRRARASVALDAIEDPVLRLNTQAEQAAALRGLLAGVPCFVMDPIGVLRHSENRIRQARYARAAGFSLPASLYTNDAAEAQAFVLAHPRGVITKMWSSFGLVEDGTLKTALTSRVTQDDLEALNAETLAMCPVTLQELVEKDVELRITVVGDEVFASEIDVRGVDNAALDWRREGAALASTWRRHQLSEAVRTGALEVCRRFGLNYGALDVLRTPEGRHVFLEVNPAGEFLWMDETHEGAIADALANHLATPGPKRHLNLQDAAS